MEKKKIDFLKIISIFMCMLVFACGVSIPCVAAPAGDYKDFEQRKYADSKLVKVNKDGSLTYNKDPQSDAMLPDFSCVGYHSGEKDIPDVKIVKTLESGKLEDHTKLIQDAIDEICKLPYEQRGAILLKSGVYIISNTIKIPESGIVLRGEGQGVNGTIIYDARNAKVNTAEISGNGAYKVIDGSASKITDSYVPLGKTKIHISQKDKSKYKVGDLVLVTLSPNEKWVETLGVDQLSGSGKPWKPEEYVMEYERTIKAIKGNEITLDTSVTMTIDEKLMKATISRITDEERIAESGIENIRFVSYYNLAKKDDESHARTAVTLKNCRNCWVSDVSAYNYSYSCVAVSSCAKNITIEYCSFLEPISKNMGGRRYSFVISSASYVLIKNCYSSDSRHDYVVQSRTAGPNVFYSSVADDSSSVSEPHHRWGTGTLYDNVYQVGANRLGYFEAIMRGNSGSGHGWAGVNTVFWNSLSPGVVVRKPQTEQNFAIGSYGLYGGNAMGMDEYKKWYVAPKNEDPNYPEEKSKSNSPLYGNGYIESWYNPVNPSSLYQAQLSYKLKKDALADITPPAPILNFPAYDATTKESEITVSGICDLNAEKVIIYVDGKKTEVIPDITEKSGKFSAEVKLIGGYHEIYVSQIIAGFESGKTPSRTVYVNNGDKYDKPAKDLQTILVERGNAAAIEVKNNKIKNFISNMERCEELASNNFNETVKALLDVEKAIEEKRDEDIDFAFQFLKLYISKIERNVEDIKNISQEAKAFGCDAESIEKIDSLVRKTEKYFTDANILLERCNREIKNGKVDSFPYTDELKEEESESGEKFPILIIVLIVAAMLLAVAVIWFIIKRKKNFRKTSEI